MFFFDSQLQLNRNQINSMEPSQLIIPLVYDINLNVLSIMKGSQGLHMNFITNQLKRFNDFYNGMLSIDTLF